MRSDLAVGPNEPKLHKFTNNMTVVNLQNHLFKMGKYHL